MTDLQLAAMTTETRIASTMGANGGQCETRRRGEKTRRRGEKTRRRGEKTRRRGEETRGRGEKKIPVSASPRLPVSASPRLGILYFRSSRSLINSFTRIGCNASSARIVSRGER